MDSLENYGSIVLVIGNSADTDYDVPIEVGRRTDNNTMHVKLPTRSINTFIIPPVK